MQDFLHFPAIFAIFYYISEFCSTFGTLHFEKSSNTAKSLEKVKKNLSIILLLKWSLLEPKMLILNENTSPLFSLQIGTLHTIKTKSVVYLVYNLPFSAM